MALRMYTSDEFVPSNLDIIRNNDYYFDFYVQKMVDSEVGRNLIKIVEKGKYVNEKVFIGQFADGGLDVSCLSTGSKTLFNIIGNLNSNKCFDTVECGRNALQFMLDNIDGNVIIPTSTTAQIIDESREYYVNGVRVMNDNDFTEVLENVKNK